MLCFTFNLSETVDGKAESFLLKIRSYAVAELPSEGCCSPIGVHCSRSSHLTRMSEDGQMVGGTRLYKIALVSLHLVRLLAAHR